LQKVTDNSAELLLLVPVNIDKNSNSKNLKIKCSGNLINIYNGMELINSWESPQRIFGKAGVYADKNVLVKFQNIHISGNE
jgi:hypothetical protein